MDYRSFPAQAQNVFLPKVMVGMSAKSKRPEEAEEAAFTEFVRTLKQPVIADERVSGLVYEAGVGVLEGTIGVEKAVEGMAKKAAIYLAE